MYNCISVHNCIERIFPNETKQYCSTLSIEKNRRIGQIHSIKYTSIYSFINGDDTLSRMVNLKAITILVFYVCVNGIYMHMYFY